MRFHTKNMKETETSFLDVICFNVILKVPYFEQIPFREKNHIFYT